MLREYEYNSVLSSFIEGLINQKRLSGYIYEYEAYILKIFDNYCIEKSLNDPLITKSLLDEWYLLRSTESKGYRYQRISFVRQLSLYMNSLGIPSYIPKKVEQGKSSPPHIMTDDEISAFFYEADTRVSKTLTNRFDRMAVEYRFAFRLIYCCGLRNSEACNLRKSDVDLKQGILTIIHSKGDKDRLVYMADDLAALGQKYLNYIVNECPNTEWFFPALNLNDHLAKTLLDRKFNEFWGRTDFSKKCDKKPTVHCLRHSFVVKRMNLWMEQNLDFNAMMPYLSKYLGHKGRNETFYYYHQAESAFNIIREKDISSVDIIPEVFYEEE